MYTSQQYVTENSPNNISFQMLLDPTILKAARYIYHIYFEVDPEREPRPMGVAIDRYTYRGKVIFSDRPILLPQEYFIPFSQIESEIY